MRRRTDRMGRPIEDHIRQMEFVRLRHGGYLSYRQLMGLGAVLFTVTTAFIAVISLTRVWVMVLLTATFLAIEWALIGFYVMRNNTVTVTADGGLYVAQETERGIVRHGPTAEEALANLVEQLEAVSDGAA